MPFQIFLAAYLPSITIRKIVILIVLIWSIATVLSVYLVEVYVIFDLSWCHYRRHLLCSGPLRQRLVSDKERTQANSIIQYYGRVLALGGIYDFVPLDAAFGWRNVCIITVV